MVHEGHASAISNQKIPIPGIRSWNAVRLGYFAYRSRLKWTAPPERGYGFDSHLPYPSDCCFQEFFNGPPLHMKWGGRFFNKKKRPENQAAL